MKIVALHTDFRLYWPGRLQALSHHFKVHGHELNIIEIAGQGSLYSFADRNVTPSVNQRCLFPNKKIEDLSPDLAKKATMEELDKLNPDIIVSGAFAFSSGAAALDWGKAHNKAVVIFDDSKTEDVPRSFVVNAIKKIFFSYTDAIVCPAKDWLPTFTHWGLKPDAVFYGMNVVDNSFWKQKSDTSLPYNLPARYLLCVGRQVNRKNFNTVIQAFTQFKTQHPDPTLELVLVGDGTEHDALQNLAQGNVRQSIHFLPFVDPATLRTIYQQALALILPSHVEQWGLVVNEAMASGLPVIVSKQCGCVNALVQNNVNGFIFDANDVETLEACITKMDTMKPDTIRKMGEKSADIISHWDLDHFCQGVMDACNYAIQHKKKPYYFIGKFLLQKWNGRYNIG